MYHTNTKTKLKFEATKIAGGWRGETLTHPLRRVEAPSMIELFAKIDQLAASLTRLADNRFSTLAVTLA